MKESGFSSILSDAARGDRGSLTALYARYHPMLVRYLRPLAPGVGEQLAHEAWLAAAAKLDGFDGDERDFRILLLSEAGTQVRRHQRSVRRGSARPPAPQVIDLRFSPVGDEPVTDAAIAGLLSGLSPHQSQILLLRVVGGLTAEETAGLLREKPATIRLTEHEALQQIARRLQTEEHLVG